jgi:hypothetical protein
MRERSMREKQEGKKGERLQQTKEGLEESGH